MFVIFFLGSFLIVSLYYSILLLEALVKDEIIEKQIVITVAYRLCILSKISNDSILAYFDACG